MVKKKKVVRKKATKKVSKKSVKMDKCACGFPMKNVCKCDVGMIKLASMAFILFLITVWPAAMDLVHKIHWGWFLGAVVLFSIKPMTRNCCKK